MVKGGREELTKKFMEKIGWSGKKWSRKIKENGYEDEIIRIIDKRRKNKKRKRKKGNGVRGVRGRKRKKQEKLEKEEEEEKK